MISPSSQGLIISIPCGEIGRRIRPGRYLPVLQFQFLVVRLGDFANRKLCPRGLISVPCGEIRSSHIVCLPTPDSYFNSLW